MDHVASRAARLHYEKTKLELFNSEPRCGGASCGSARCGGAGGTVEPQQIITGFMGS